MPKIIEGILISSKLKFAIIVSRFNEFITKRLRDGAIDALIRHGVKERSIDLIYCPGAFEIPQVAQRLTRTHKYDAIICLGCIIRGDTPHFEYISASTAIGIMQVSLNANIPIVFGVLTTESLEQAIERAGSKSGNKGAEAAIAAIEMANLWKKIPDKKGL